MNKTKRALAILALTGTAGLLSGCGPLKLNGAYGFGPRESHLVKIADNGSRTEMLVYDGDSVASLLTDAGIELGDRDKISEATDETVCEDMDIEIDRYAKVTVCDGETGEEKEVELTGGKVADALKAAGVEVKGHDYLDQEEDAWLTDGMTIHLIRRVEVTLTADGKTEKGLTEGKTVQDYLTENDITLGELDRITPEVDTELEEGTEIVIRRVGVKEEKVTETIAYSTTTKKDSSMAKGKTKVKTAGVNGEKVLTYKVTYVDGVEESRELVSEEVTKEPVTEVILKGTYVAPKKSSSGSSSGKKIVSREYQDDCDGSGHGRCKITYSDGSVKYTYY